MTDDEPDLGEAVEYILAERPDLDENDIWAVVVELGDPPPPGTDDVAVELLKQTRPDVDARSAKVILSEWRAYVSLATEPDWDDQDDA